MCKLLFRFGSKSFEDLRYQLKEYNLIKRGPSYKELICRNVKNTNLEAHHPENRCSVCSTTHVCAKKVCDSVLMYILIKIYLGSL